jgi:hypothetical protein
LEDQKNHGSLYADGKPRAEMGIPANQRRVSLFAAGRTGRILPVKTSGPGSQIEPC